MTSDYVRIVTSSRRLHRHNTKYLNQQFGEEKSFLFKNNYNPDFFKSS